MDLTQVNESDKRDELRSPLTTVSDDSESF